MYRCIECPPKRYTFEKNAQICNDCPLNAECPGGNIISPNPGYWTESSTSSSVY